MQSLSRVSVPCRPSVGALRKHCNQTGKASLFEIMMLAIILTILAAVIVPAVIKRPHALKVITADKMVRKLELALQKYQLDNRRYPTMTQGLQALVTKPTTGPVPPHWKPYLQRLPVDPWGRSYQYRNPGLHGPVDVWSFGPRGSAAGASGAGVIGDWNLPRNTQNSSLSGAMRGD